MYAFIRRAGGVAAALLLLAGCGTDSQTSTVATSTARGTLVENPPLRIASLTAAALQAELQASGTSGQQLLQLAGTPLPCGVDFHYFHYETVDPAGKPIRDSGGLMIPTGTGNCTGGRPVVLYAHGTQVDQTMNIADITDPANSEGALIATLFAASGYIVVAPNYAGYDDSTLSYHPYLNADQQSKDMIDALTAARSALGKVMASGTTDNGKLFITGYSQGGHVAMATHAALQAAGKTVTASAPMSGPYALLAFGDAIMTGHVDLGSTVFTPMLTESYQKAYGNIYTAPSDTYESAYASSIENILPSGTPLATLFSTGKLPQLQLFKNTDWTGTLGNPQLEAVLNVPAIVDAQTQLFAAGFGPNNLVKDSYRQSYVVDAATPATAVAPSNPLRIAFKTNDLRNWVPMNPVLMCGGKRDPTVFYPVNTSVMAGFWAADPYVQAPVDVDPYPSVPTPAPTLQYAFYSTQVAQYTQAYAAAQAANPSGNAAQWDAAAQAYVVQNYHGTVAPFCTLAARTFFANF